MESLSQCLANLSIHGIEEIYGVDREVAPFVEECRSFESLLFNGHSECFTTQLCYTTFSSNDAAILRNILENTSKYRDVNFDLILNIVRSCPEGNNSNVEALRKTLEEEGFVICSSYDSSKINRSEAIADLKALFERFNPGSSSSLVLSERAEIQCNSSVPSGGDRRRRSVNGVQTIGLLSNGTNATSSNTLCGVIGSGAGLNVTLDCPVCGNGLPELGEECDDGDLVSGDGCSCNCTVEEGFSCRVPDNESSECFPKMCGDGVRVAGEDCDAGSSGFGCDPSECIIQDGFTCPVNEEFKNRSECFNCGNGIVEFFEKCDTGVVGSADGCNDSCSVVPLFTCSGSLGLQSGCTHVAVDFNVADSNSINRTVLFRKVNEEVLLAPVQENLNTGGFGPEDWSKIEVVLSNPADKLEERLRLSLDAAEAAGRVTSSQRQSVFVLTGNLFGLPSSSEGIQITPTNPADLAVVLSSIIYSTTAPDFDLRLVYITVFDSSGFPAPTVTVAVQYVGINKNSPVLNISREEIQFEEGSLIPVSVTSGTLTVEDPDHQHHLMRSAKVVIIRGTGSLNITNDQEEIISTVDSSGRVILLSGNATEESYAAVLNKVSYISLEKQFFGLSDAVVEFSVFDGKYSGRKSVTVRLIDFNVAPEVRFGSNLQTSINYTEGRSPGFLTVAVNISDIDQLTNITEAKVILTTGQNGDILEVNRTLSALFGITVQSWDNNQTLILKGETSLNKYEAALSTVSFSNKLSSPVNLSTEERIGEMFVSDGQNYSAPAFVKINVSPVNDGPIFQFKPIDDPPAFASFADRSHAVTFTENGPPVNLLPLSTDLNDVDSTMAGKATVSFDASHDGDILSVDEANTFNIQVNGVGTSKVTLSGVALFGVYLQLLQSSTYQNVNGEPANETSVVAFIVWDQEGTASLPVFVTVTTKFVNDGPLVDLGVGVGRQDEIFFTENEQKGEHVLSRPHAVKISDSIEGNNIQKMTVSLVGGKQSELDPDELIFFMPCSTTGISLGNLTYQADSFGKTLTFTGIDNGELYSKIAGRIYYVSTADEPTIFVDNPNIKINRRVVFTVVDDGRPQANTSAASKIEIVTVNDNRPVIMVQGGSQCVSKRQEQRRRRDVESSLPDTRMEGKPLKAKRIHVSSVHVHGSPHGNFTPGSAIVVRFSHKTNTPKVLKSSHLAGIMSLSPEPLSKASTVSIWNDSRTLVILFPTGARHDDGTLVSTKDTEIRFTAKKDPCDVRQSCHDGICHSSGVPCRVIGTYGPGSSNVTINNVLSTVGEEQTVLIDWNVAALTVGGVLLTAGIVVLLACHRRNKS
eukprot:m.303900 g.303900  ORF g.303900 m.303900 type:complete len:1317 (+) comp40843_c0_seq7:4945-8895(+)